MTLVRTTTAALLAATLSLASTGCIKSMLLNGQIKGTRDASAAIDTVQDYEVANAIAFAGLGQLEGMHRLAPDNSDGLFMLTKSWGGAAYAFIEDKYEQAYEKNDDAMANYELQRARAAYERAIYYGLELLGQTASGFQQARRNEATITAWLDKNFTDKDDAPNLLWTGYAWVSNVNISKDEPAVVGELFIGIAMVKRSLELDDTLEHGMGHIILGSYYASFKQWARSKQEFDRAMAIGGGKFLPTELNLATKYYCARSDKPDYEKTLNAVLAAGDDLPDARLQNVIAKRRARRYLGNSIWQEDCGFM
jgi:tetratricopeptide (TPR) repeat protein